MKTVGIIGGLGPAAGAYFYKRLIELSPATKDEEHVPVILISDPTIPSRVHYLSGHGSNPVPQLRQVLEKLQSAGADIIAMPSSTTHALYADVQPAAKVLFPNMIREIASELHRRGVERIGILGTTPMQKWGVYDAVLQNFHIQAVYPDDHHQNELMKLIFRVKQGEEPDKQFSSLENILSQAWSTEIDDVLLACTELPIVYQNLNGEETAKINGLPTVYDATTIFAKVILRLANS